MGHFYINKLAGKGVNFDIPQLNNIAEEAGLQVKYIMTYAAVNMFSYPVLDDVMQYLERCHMANKWMPVYFGIMDKMYKDSDKCIIMPYTINNISSTIDFMPLKHLYQRDIGPLKDTFREYGYYDVPEEDIVFFRQLTLKCIYQHELETPDSLQFINTYPRLKRLFKPDNYCLYNTGFVNRWDKKKKEVIQRAVIVNDTAAIQDADIRAADAIQAATEAAAASENP